MLLPFVSRRIAELNEKGYLIMIVSNQGGVAKGLLPIETADKALKYTADLIKVENAAATIHFIDFAEQEDSFRKPLTGMAVNLSLALAKKNLKIDWTQSFMVGDSAYKKGDLRPDGQPGTHFSNSDRLFAENLNIPFYEPNKFFGWKCHGIDVFDKAEQVTNYLRENPDRCEVLAGPIKKPSHEGRLMN
jgi:DNA 3'-phosphatase